MGTFIAASGNLAEPPTLAHDDKTGRAYAYLRVLVSGDYRDDAGAWHKTPPTEYRVRVTGKRAERIAEVAAEAGNVAIVFAGDVTEKPWGTTARGGINRTITQPAVIGYDVIGQDVTIAPRGRARARAVATTTSTTSDGGAAQVEQIDLEAAWQGLVSGTLELHEVPYDVMAIYMLGVDHGRAAMLPQLQQAQRDADRLYVQAMNPADRAAAILARMDAVDTSDMSEHDAIHAQLGAGADVASLRGRSDPTPEPVDR
ncbi:hypothetical protein GCM10009846_22460 [Agrococcus versicolor]|uniref:Single-stranded DNA-binding protein n=1 Tax=Agrococcus versicolor TaxID=501482 RepID=A0ABN3AU83_9MICO